MLGVDRAAPPPHTLEAVARHRTLSGEDLRSRAAPPSPTGVRRDIITTIQGAGLGHIGGDLSVTDILVTAYWHALQVDPTQPGRPPTATASS